MVFAKGLKTLLNIHLTLAVIMMPITGHLFPTTIQMGNLFIQIALLKRSAMRATNEHIQMTLRLQC